MDSKQFASTYGVLNSDNFPAGKLPLIVDKLSTLDESGQISLAYLQLKNPIVTIILSILLGGFAIDRFYIGDIGLGIVKLICSVLCFMTVILAFIPPIWVLIDIYLCYKKTKEKNFEKLMLALN